MYHLKKAAILQAPLNPGLAGRVTCSCYAAAAMGVAVEV